jgi:protein-tyrosine phosphatase
MIDRILVVCVGNICRSPTAEVLLRDRLKDRNIQVESAGLAALVGAPVDPVAQSVLVDNGLSAADHVARQLSREMLSAAGMVVAMDKRHISAILALAPETRGKTFLLGRWQGELAIPDPYGRDRGEFENAFELIRTAVDSWVTRL